jgi:hypothetical protein
MRRAKSCWNKNKLQEKEMKKMKEKENRKKKRSLNLTI